MDEPVRWGVLGAARIARSQVVPAIQRSGNGQVVAVSSASGGAVEFAAELGIERAYESHEELLADPDVEAVYIPLPNAVHRDWILRAAAAGKHVLCEKPIVLGTAQLTEVEEACRQAGVLLAEAFMYRHHPGIVRVRELLADGAIGELVTLDARFHFSLARTDPPDIRLVGALGGGALNDIGCYPVDLFGLLLGQAPREVSAVARRDTPDGVDTRLAAVLGYDRAVASLDCSFDAPFLNTATLIGTHGTIALESIFRSDVSDGVITITLEHGAEPDVIEVPGDAYAGEVRAFAERVRSGAPDHDGAALTRLTTETLERITQAAGSGEGAA